MQREVLVFSGADATEKQPETFRFCPLGVQFYSREALPEFHQLEMDLKGAEGIELPSGARCEGVVVQSQFDARRGLYRNWILFLDLPEELRRRFHCFAKESGSLCPHCMNF